MRKISTRIGLYAILLIASFYGSSSLFLQRQTVPGIAVLTRKAVNPTREKAQTTRPLLGKNNNPKAAYSLIVQQSTAPFAKAGDEHSFFTHSANIQHYIN